MTHPYLKLLIFTIFILLVSCDHENEKTKKNDFEKVTNTIEEIDSLN